jgi:hypothetical protein
VKTPDEIAELKRQWVADSWDTPIEDTEGFEVHREELLAWRTEQDAKWEAERAAKVTKILERRADTRWERAVLAFITSGLDPREAIANADRFVALVQEKWVP